MTVLAASALARADALVEIEVTAVRRPELGDRSDMFGEHGTKLLGRIARWARGFAAARGRPVSRVNEQGDWLLHDLGLERSDVQSPAERLDELRRGMPFQ